MSAALAQGDVVAKRYRLIAPLGRGGMGVVWRAEHLVLGRPVAVKFVTRGGSDDVRRAQRFLNEAKAAATLRHRNVVDILDFGVSELGQPYMVMELLEGMSLRARLAAKPALSIGALLDHVDSVLAGLSAVHEAGLVHRDLKPENVFLSEQPDGVVAKLLDFGLSRVVQEERASHDAVTLTQEDQILGTPTFMSPEQVRQLDDVDPRTDIWSVGVLLYAALAGKLPFDAPKLMDLLFEITRGAVPESVVALRPEVGPALSAVVARTMERERDNRYRSAQDLRDALREARALSAEALAAPARPVPESLRGGSAGAGAGDEASASRAIESPEILTLASDAVDQSRIRERPSPARRGPPSAIATLGIVLAVGLVTAWLWSEFASEPPAPPESAAPAAGALPRPPEVNSAEPDAPAPSSAEQATEKRRTRDGASKRSDHKGVRRGDPATLFRTPDY